MSGRYISVPNHPDEQGFSEMEAAFDDSDDEGLEGEAADEQRRPLVPRDTAQSSVVGQYDFERVNYDYPPPGSPPGPSALALPANAAYGNTNGLLPSSPIEQPGRYSTPNRRWIQRILPWLTRTSNRRRGAENDGVFANIMSKPTRPRSSDDDAGLYVVPEETQSEAPPSYAAAQADAVPSYWETTIHAPSGGDVAGELIVDSLPTGSLFSFLWSMLVSVAFNFLGFVLTYLLHTTHAAKYGSRAGLGITLIQYGWALRSRADTLEGNYAGDGFISAGDGIGKPIPTHIPSTAAEAEAWRQQVGNSTTPESTIQYGGTYMLGESAAAWLSFFLMTVGWFLFLSSVLGFWRVKRWERGILHAAPAEPSSEEQGEQDVSIGFTFPGLFLREGLGLNSARQNDEEQANGERYVVQEIDRQRQIAEVRINDAQLQRNLRAAGLI